MDNLESLPSYTDRPQREGDIPGETYNFVTTEEFEKMMKMVTYTNIVYIMSIIMEHQKTSK